LVVAPGASAEEIVRCANAELEEHQKIRDVSVWPGDALPHTEGTGKLKRAEVQQWVASGAGQHVESRPRDSLESMVARYAGNRPVASETTLDELGLSSLERVALMMAIERTFGTSVDESAFTAARTVNDLQAVIQSGGT